MLEMHHETNNNSHGVVTDLLDLAHSISESQIESDQMIKGTKNNLN